MRQLNEFSEDPGTALTRAAVQQSLAKMAWNRGDSLSALALARHAKQLVLTDEPNSPAALVEAELMIASILSEETDLGPISAEITSHVNRLPDGPGKVSAEFRHRVLQAQSASRLAAETVRKDQVKRDLGRAQLKVRAVALSDQLRSEMNGENQRREKLQQEAATENDPGKMARAMKEKDSYDEKFRAELQRREDELRQQTQAALQPDVKVTEALQQAADLWKQALLFVETNGADSAQATEARLGLATALLAQDNLAGAEDAVKGLGADTAGLATDEVQLARTKLVQARVALRKSAVVAKDQAEAALAAGTTSLEASLAALAKSGKSDFRQKELAGQIQSTLANLHNAAGHKDAAAAAMSQAAALLADSAADGSWMEIMQKAQARVNQCRDMLRQSSASAVSSALSQSLELHQALVSWRAELLKDSPDAEGIASSRATAEKIVKENPDAYPWAALIPLD
jgi:hypothetical protein